MIVILNGVDYYIDHSIKALRRADNADTIPFDTLKDEGDFFTVKFIQGTDNQLPDPDMMYEYGSLISCEIPADVLNTPDFMASKN